MSGRGLLGGKMASKDLFGEGSSTSDSSEESSSEEEAQQQQQVQKSTPS